MLIKKFSLNQLTIRTFTVFWLAFFAMTALLVALPYFDSRLYSDLNQNEISSYQKKLVESIRNNRITGILAGVPVLPTDKFDSARPVIMTPEKEIFGALGEERMHIAQFAQESSNFAQPQRKTFKDIQIAGPFKVYIGDSEQSSELFFVSRANGQQEILRYMLDHPWVLLLLTLIITTPLLWWFTHTIVKPITNLQKAANSVALGNFKVDNELANHGPAELREVGQSFNKMSIAIDNLISNQHNLLSSISHELKTPIALIQGYAEGLKEGISDDPESMDFYCGVIIDEAGKMNNMVKKLLTLNQIEFGNEELVMERFDIIELITSIVNANELRASQKGIQIEFNQRDKHIDVWSDEYKIEEVVTNYITNAINHCDFENRIEVSVERIGDDVRVHVFNTGKNIPEEDIPNIWQKFYKVDKARTREYGGNGIGLSIVKAIMDRHNKECGVVNKENGVEFWFRLDCNNSEERLD